jgi:hypothetical protein
MKNFDDFEFDVPTEFGGKTDEELLQEFLDDCPVTDDAYVSVYGGYYSVMQELLPTSRNILMWMAFNCEVDRGRVVVQSDAQQRMLRELGISLVTYYKCLKDLKEHNAIRGVNARYYVNPKFMWKGGDKRRREFLKRYPTIRNEK